jgi:hypothetical protein
VPFHAVAVGQLVSSMNALGIRRAMEQHVHRRVRIRRSGLNVDADVDAVISVNVSERRTDRASEEDEADHDRDQTDRIQTEHEGGER